MTDKNHKEQQPQLLLPSFPGKVIDSPYQHPKYIWMALAHTEVHFDQEDGSLGNLVSCVGGGIMVTVKTEYGDVTVGIDPKTLFEAVSLAVGLFIETKGAP